MTCKLRFRCDGCGRWFNGEWSVLMVMTGVPKRPRKEAVKRLCDSCLTQLMEQMNWNCRRRAERWNRGKGEKR